MECYEKPFLSRGSPTFFHGGNSEIFKHISFIHSRPSNKIRSLYTTYLENNTFCNRGIFYIFHVLHIISPDFPENM